MTQGFKQLSFRCPFLAARCVSRYSQSSRVLTHAQFNHCKHHSIRAARFRCRSTALSLPHQKQDAQSSLPHYINCHGQSAAAPSHGRPHTLTACFTHMARPSMHASALQHAPAQSQASVAVCTIVGLGPPPAFFGVSMCVANWIRAPHSLPAAAVTPMHPHAQERSA